MTEIETTTRCNLSCIYCPRRVMKLEERDMTPYEVNYILKQLIPYRQVGLGLCGLGEPLMNPHFPTILRNPLLRKFPKVLFNTNGTLLTPEMVKFLVDLGVLYRITVSLQSTKKDVMEYLQRGAKFEEVVENTRNLLCYARGKRIFIRILHLTTTLNANETKADFERLLRVKLVTDERQGKFMYLKKKALPGAMGFHEEARHLGLPPYGPRVCRNIYGKTIVINVHGDLTSCCWDSTRSQTYGNIFETPLAKLRSGKLLKDLRGELVRRDFHRLPLCRMCLT